MKTITAVVVLGLIIAVAFFFRTNTTSTPEVTDIQSAPTDNVTLHPYSISSLRNRQFPVQTLTVESQVTPNSQIVSYLSDDLRLRALMVTPSGTPPVGGWPVVIVNHGYIPPSEYSVTRSYINTSNYFASQGFLVLKPDYRGHDDSEGVSSGRLLSRSEYTVDVLSLLSTISSISIANPDQLFMYGHSMGGDITLQILEITDKIKAATLWAPAVTTLPDQVTHFMNRNRPTPGEPEKFKSQYDEFIKQYPITQISPFDNLDLVNVPLNLHHGTVDESVPYEWGVALNDKLKSLAKSVNFYPYQGDNHDIAANFSTALSRDAAFFKSFL